MATYYPTDADVSGEYYKGNTVPGTNTVDSATHVARKAATTRIINGYLRVASTNATGTSRLAEIPVDEHPNLNVR